MNARRWRRYLWWGLLPGLVSCVSAMPAYAAGPASVLGVSEAGALHVPSATRGNVHAVRSRGRKPGRRGASPRVPREASAGPASCETMRARRAAAYAAAGLKRDFALSSYWDNKVHDACR